MMSPTFAAQFLQAKGMESDGCLQRCEFEMKETIFRLGEEDQKQTWNDDDDDDDDEWLLGSSK